jgi:AcrR family transcriptional regulator
MTDGAGPRRAEQAAQTRAALIGAARDQFGRRGFSGTSVEEVARAARVTTGALYHHFGNKTALFEAVFLVLHAELLAASTEAAGSAADEVDALLRAFEAYLDAVLVPEVQRIVVTDGPAVLGPARYTELDEEVAFGAVSALLRGASDRGLLSVADPDTLARLLLGALTRAGTLIAGADDPPAARRAVARTLRDLVAGLGPTRA